MRFKIKKNNNIIGMIKILITEIIEILVNLISIIKINNNNLKDLLFNGKLILVKIIKAIDTLQIVMILIK